MKKKRFIFLLFLFPLSSCLLIGGNKGFYEQFQMEYSDKEIDIEGLDNYLTNNEDYLMYDVLKENNPNLLNNVKKIEDEYEYDGKTHDREPGVDFYRFSNTDNGFLNNETFVSGYNTYYQIGKAIDGYGVTDIITNHGDRGFWIYVIDSYCIEEPKTEIKVYRMHDGKKHNIKNLEIDSTKNYCFEITDKNTIDLYEAEITPSYDEDGFISFEITKTNLYKEAIDEMRKIEE